MSNWTEWSLAWDGRSDNVVGLPIDEDQLPALWIQWRYRFQINTGFAQNEAAAGTQTLLGLMGGWVPAMAVGQINGQEFQHRVIFNISTIVKWELITKFTVVSLAYQMGGFAFYTWYSPRQELITYLPGTGNNLGLDQGNASVVRARELDKFHPVSKIVTSVSGESAPWEEGDVEVTGEPLETLGTRGITVIQDTTSDVGYPQDVQLYGWFLGPMYRLNVPTGAYIDIKFHNIGVPVGDKWAYIETRTSTSVSPVIPKAGTFQGDNPGTNADKNPIGLPSRHDNKNIDIKNAYFTAGATDNVGRSEVYYTDEFTGVIRQFLGVTNFEESRDNYESAVVMDGGKGINIVPPNAVSHVDAYSVVGNAPEFAKNDVGISIVFFHTIVSNRLLEEASLYRSLIAGVAIKTKDDFSNLQTGKLRIFFDDQGGVTVQEVDEGTDFVEQIIVYNNRLVKNSTYEFIISTITDENGGEYFTINDAQKGYRLYCVQSSDEGETWERSTGNLENKDNFNSGNITVGGVVVGGIKTNPNSDPVLISENESYPIAVKYNGGAGVRLFSVRNNNDNYNIVVRDINNVDLYTQMFSGIQHRYTNIEDTSMLFVAGNMTPSIHQYILDNSPHVFIGGFRLSNVDANGDVYYHCLTKNCRGTMTFAEYRNSGSANDDAVDMDKKYDQIIYRCNVCGQEFDIMSLFYDELIIEQPVSVANLPSGENRIFYIVGPREWELKTNYINYTGVDEYDYIPSLEGFEIVLNNNISDSTWTVYVDGVGNTSFYASPTSAHSSVVYMNAKNNPMLWNSTFTFSIRNSGSAKIFSIPGNVLMSRYTNGGDFYIYDKQFNRSMFCYGHSAVSVSYNYRLNSIKVFSYYDGAIYLHECPQNVLWDLQEERKDGGLLEFSEEELANNTNGIQKNTKVYLIWGKVKREYQEKINLMPDKYFLGNFAYRKTEIEGGNPVQYYICPEDDYQCDGLICFHHFSDDDDVIYKCTSTGNDVNISLMTANDDILEQVVSYNCDEQGTEHIYFRENGSNVDVTDNSIHDDIYNGVVIKFGSLKEGWVSILFKGTKEQDDLILGGTARDSVLSATIDSPHLVGREFRFTIAKKSNSDGYEIRTNAIMSALIYNGERWLRDDKNLR